MRSIKDKLGLAWLTPTYITNGWTFFLKEEAYIVGISVVVAMSVFKFLGCASSFCAWKFALLAIAIRRFIAGGICSSTKRLDGKLVVITGANTGIGRETAKDLLIRGADIIIACRDMDTGTHAANELRLEFGGKCSAMKCDLSSFESIRGFCEQFSAKHSKLDMLINNAGIMMCPESKTVDGVELQCQTNYLGHFLLTSLLMPYLRKAPEARIINVSSMLHWIAKMDPQDINSSKGYCRSIAYANSKLANILFTIGLNKRFAGSNVQSFAVHPGYTTSNISRHLPFGLDALQSNGFKIIAKTTAEGAQTSIYCATEATLCPHAYYSDCQPGNSSDAARDIKLSDQLWKTSEDICKVVLK